MNCTGSFCLLQNTFGPCRIDCGLRLSENIPCEYVCVYISHKQLDSWVTCWPVPVSFRHKLLKAGLKILDPYNCSIVSELRLTQCCQRVEYEVADYIYETRSSLVEICREEPASSIVIFDTSVPFYQTTRRHIPEDSSPHSRRCENLKSLNPVRFIFGNTAELHLSGRWLPDRQLSGSAWPFVYICRELKKTNFPWSYRLSDQVQYNVMASRTSNQARSKGLDAGTYCK